MGKPTLFLTRQLPDAVMTAIEDRFHLTATPAHHPIDRPALLAGIADAEAVMCTLAETIDDTILGAAPRLKIVANYAVGYNNIDVDSARARNVIVTNTPDILTHATADLTWALLLATARRIPEGHSLVQQGQWPGWRPDQLLGTEVSGQILGIIGMGRIGLEVAKRARGFSMPVLYHSRHRSSTPDRMWQQVSFDEVLARADFLTLHVPLTPDTHHLIGTPQFRRMKSSACLINTSRGPVVDEAALVQALRERRLAGAGLDVYEAEPAIHPGLRGLPQVVTLPHLGSATLDTRVRMGFACLDNIAAVLEGKAAPNRVV